MRVISRQFLYQTNIEPDPTQKERLSKHKSLLTFVLLTLHAFMYSAVYLNLWSFYSIFSFPIKTALQFINMSLRLTAVGDHPTVARDFVSPETVFNVFSGDFLTCKCNRLLIRQFFFEVKLYSAKEMADSYQRTVNLLHDFDGKRLEYFLGDVLHWSRMLNYIRHQSL